MPQTVQDTDFTEHLDTAQPATVLLRHRGCQLADVAAATTRRQELSCHFGGSGETTSSSGWMEPGPSVCAKGQNKRPPQACRQQAKPSASPKGFLDAVLGGSAHYPSILGDAVWQCPSRRGAGRQHAGDTCMPHWEEQKETLLSDQVVAVVSPWEMPLPAPCPQLCIFLCFKFTGGKGTKIRTFVHITVSLDTESRH